MPYQTAYLVHSHLRRRNLVIICSQPRHHEKNNISSTNVHDSLSGDGGWSSSIAVHAAGVTSANDPLPTSPSTPSTRTKKLNSNLGHSSTVEIQYPIPLAAVAHIPHVIFGPATNRTCTVCPSNDAVYSSGTSGPISVLTGWALASL